MIERLFQACGCIGIRQRVQVETECTAQDAAGKHLMQCGDWETSATFWRLSKSYGEQATLDHLSKTFNEEYPSKGMAFAMGTMKNLPKQWMLLGVIRLDEMRQESFTF